MFKTQYLCLMIPYETMRLPAYSQVPSIYILCACSKRKLVPWLRLILRNQTVVETMYQPWSYAVTTGNNV